MRLTASALDGPGWDAYLFAALGLLPFVAGLRGTPIAALDLVNLVALTLFVAVVVVHRIRLELPLVVPVLLAAAGSVFATVNAVSLRAAGLALAQDVYLYVWAVALVALLRRRGDLVRERAAWVVVAVLVAIACLVEGWTHGTRSLASLLSPTGHRSLASFGNTNMCADVMLLGVFALLSLAGRVRRAVVAAGFLVLFAGMLTTKSNGALCALAAGLAVWGAIRAWARGARARLAGTAALAAATVLVAGWLVGEAGVGGAWLQRIAQHTVLARVAHSGESRGRIWSRLEHTFVHAPLGIGPGNSSEQYAEIGERERKGDMQSKEAHSDYLAYTAERGPLGIAGLLAALALLGARLVRSRRWLDERMGGAEQGVVVQAACLGAFAALLVQSTVIEQLHFRHVWWSIAWMWAATGPRVLAPALVTWQRRAHPSGATA